MAARAPRAAASLHILRTKLHPPGRRPGTVDRDRLIDRTPRFDRPRLTLVSAPAGFGKTTLLASWFLSGAGASEVAWLSLDARDDDPTTFWTYVVEALRTVAPEIGADVLGELGASTGASVVGTLVAELELLGRDLVLVLDDFHVIESPDIHEGISFLLDHLPAGVGLVIATRVDPPIPLARLRARGELVERRAADLRFTEDEVARYFNDTIGVACHGSWQSGW